MATEYRYFTKALTPTPTTRSGPRLVDAPATPAASKATATKPAATSKAMTVDSKLLQQAIIDLGGSVGAKGPDGLWGPDSKNGMKQVCTSHGVFYTSSDRVGASVKVNPEGAAVLIIGLSEIKKGKDISAQSLKTPGMVYTQVLQTLLNKLGYLPKDINGKNQLDGKLGPNTQKALGDAALKLNAYYYSGTTAFAKLAGTTIKPAAMYLKLWQAMWFGPAASAAAETSKEAAKEATREKTEPAKKKPKEQPKVAGKPGKAYKSKDIQQLLLDIGMSLPKFGADGKWGKESLAALQAAASKYNLKYKSAGAFSKLAMVQIDPGDLVDGLQAVLVRLRAGQATDEALKAKAKEKAKKKKSEKDTKRAKEEQAKADKAKDDAAAAEQKSKEADAKAKKAAEKASKKDAKAADKAAAKKAKEEAKKAKIEAKKKKAEADAQQGTATETKSEAAQASQEAAAASQAAAATTQQAQTVITDSRAQAAQLPAISPVYAPTTAPVYAPSAEEEVEMPAAPAAAAAAAAEPSAPAPAPAGIGTGVLIAGGIAAAAAVYLFMRKKKPSAAVQGFESAYRSKRRQMLLKKKRRFKKSKKVS